MKSIMKRAAALLTSIMMIFSVMPVTAMADGSNNLNPGGELDKYVTVKCYYDTRLNSYDNGNQPNYTLFGQTTVPLTDGTNVITYSDYASASAYRYTS